MKFKRPIQIGPAIKKNRKGLNSMVLLWFYMVLSYIDDVRRCKWSQRDTSYSCRPLLAFSLNCKILRYHQRHRPRPGDTDCIAYHACPSYMFQNAPANHMRVDIYHVNLNAVNLSAVNPNAKHLTKPSPITSSPHPQRLHANSPPSSSPQHPYSPERLKSRATFQARCQRSLSLLFPSP
jgi:hypothetical protein